MLGSSFHWLDCPEGSYLNYNARCIAVVKSGSVTIRWKGCVTGRCGSVAQGKRYVERWMEGRLRRGGRPTPYPPATP